MIKGWGLAYVLTFTYFYIVLLTFTKFYVVWVNIPTNANIFNSANPTVIVGYVFKCS